jgi:HK97 family phage prohead protease
MTTRLTRAHAVELEVRTAGRTIVGIAVPYDTPTEIHDRSGSYTEIFRQGAFARTLAERGPERVKVLAQHNYEAMPLGRAVLLREDTAGLYAELAVSKTSAGDEVLELVRDGALDGLSIGFTPVRDGRETRGVVERLEAKLHEVSVVSFPAYDTARVAALRGQSAPSSDLLAQRRLELRRTLMKGYTR